jgi:hypothetical protein
MKIFVSYARNDREAVDLVLQDMRRARHDVWVDQELTGGQAWWDTILANIRDADVFVVALSLDALKSRACAAEYEYAIKCGRTILPVMVAHVPPQMCPPAIANAQIIDYVERTPNAAINLVTALAAAAPPGPLPDPLPVPPPVPMSYMNKYNDMLAEHSLTLQQQSQLLSELRAHLNDEDDRDTAIQYIRRLRSRGDITESVGREIDALLASQPPSQLASQPTPPPPPPQSPGGNSDQDSTYATRDAGVPVPPPPPPPTPPVRTADATGPEGPFSTGAFVGLIVATVLIPLIGIVVGAISLKKPRRRTQAQILLAVGIATVVLYVLATA